MLLLENSLYCSLNYSKTNLISTVHSIPAVRQQYEKLSSVDSNSRDSHESLEVHSPLQEFGFYERNRNNHSSKFVGISHNRGYLL